MSPPGRFARRDFLRNTLRASCAAGMASVGGYSVAARPESRSISLYALHTLERIDSQYWVGGSYQPTELARINRVLRDHRTHDICAIDVRLLDLLHAIQQAFNCDVPFHVISGYRCAATNAMLRRSTARVASKSYHMLGRAVDFRIPGVASSDLRDVAVHLGVGGVGFYQKSDFVHLDTGPVRRW